MRIIELDGKNWKNALDFYEALLAALGSPKEHGRNANALVDSMIWGGLNAVEPPYIVRVSGTNKLPKEARDEIEMVRQDLCMAGAQFKDLRGRDVGVCFEIEP